jgi:molybdate transport system substrate-binding protein
MKRLAASTLVAAAMLLGGAACNSATPDGTIKISAASDLAVAFEEVGKAFTAKTGKKVQIDYGSTGQFSQQILAGAKVDLFASADRKNVDKVVAGGKCDGATAAPYGIGRLVLWVKSGTAPTGLAGLTDPRWKRIAIANPDHAPYGMAARDALQKAGLWDALQDRIVIGENIRATMQFAQTGNAEVAISALSLALASKDGTYVEIPAAAHAQIDQTLVVCGKGAGVAGGKAFAAFVASTEGKAIMAKYGFVAP